MHAAPFAISTSSLVMAARMMLTDMTVASARHKKKAEAAEKSTKMTNFFSRTSTVPDDLAVIRAETLFAHFLVEHNIPLSASDHADQHPSPVNF